MEREIIITADGSHSIKFPGTATSYHSVHGALTESLHVFIDTGLKEAFRLHPGDIDLLEVGLGTGLNALLTAMEADNHQRRINYTALEPFPLEREMVEKLNYGSLIPGSEEILQALHQCDWSKTINISPYFSFRKEVSTLQKWNSGSYHLVYFDAFAPETQPELWEESLFHKLIGQMKEGGLLVTYCAKGSVRRALQAAGFQTERLKGPPGKREMLRARVAQANP